MYGVIKGTGIFASLPVHKPRMQALPTLYSVRCTRLHLTASSPPRPSRAQNGGMNRYCVQCRPPVCIYSGAQSGSSMENNKL